MLDEIGLPLANASVTLRIGGSDRSVTTNADGYICLSDPPGTSAEVKTAEIHEVDQGDSTSTPSGNHFGYQQAGP